MIALSLSTTTGERIDELSRIASLDASLPRVRTLARQFAGNGSPTDRIATVRTALQRVPNLLPRVEGTLQMVNDPFEVFTTGGDCTAKSLAACTLLRAMLVPAELSFVREPTPVDHLVCVAWDGRAWQVIDGTAK